MPQNDATNATSINTLTVICRAAMPPLITIISLRNRPNGGSPMAARAANPINSTVTGRTFHHAGTDDAKFERVKSLMDVARREEQHRFGQRVIAHVEQRAENGHWRVHGNAGAYKTDVFEARIGQHPFEIPLHQNERRGQKHGEQPKTQKKMAAEPGAEAGRGQNVKSQQGVERDFERHAGKHRAGGRGRLAVRVGQPGVHRRQAGLGAVADERKHEGQFDQAVVELWGNGHQVRPVEAGQLFRCVRADGRRVKEHRAQQRQRQAEAAENDVFPGGFERGLAVVERDQQHGGQRGRFHRKPHHAQIVGQHDQKHSRREQRRQHEKLAHAPRVTDLASRSRWKYRPA